MSRSRRRVSRALISVLAVTLALGGVVWLHNLKKSEAAAADAKAAEVAKVAAPDPVQPDAPAAKAEPDTPPVGTVPVALVTQTPTAAPGPATPVALNAPADRAATPLPSPAPGGNPKPAANAPAAKPDSPTAAVPTSDAPLADAKQRFEAGDALTARRILNAALQSEQLQGADAAAAKQLLNQVNDVVVFSPRKFADDEFGGSYSVKPGERLQSIAREHEVTWELLCRVNGLSDPRRMRAGQTLKVLKGPFHAVVDKSDFTMEVYLGNPGEPTSTYVTSYKVGLGADDSTPTGTWLVEPNRKIKNPTYYSPRGGGVIEADDPENPLGEYWIALTGIDGHAVGKESYGIHGTIEPDSIGKQASMGCIRMGNEDITRVFELLVDGKSTVMVRE